MTPAKTPVLLPRNDPGSIPEVLATNAGQAQFGIVQGGIHPHLRTESAQATITVGFDAYAIGGLSVGEPPEVTYDVVARRSGLGTAAGLRARPHRGTGPGSLGYRLRFGPATGEAVPYETPRTRPDQS